MKTKKQILEELDALRPALNEALEEMNKATTWPELLRLTAKVNYTQGKLEAYSHMIRYFYEKSIRDTS